MLPQRISRPLRAAILLGSALFLSACADRTTQQITGSTKVGPKYVVAVPEGMSLQCPPRPTVKARAVEAGAEHDLNGNGVVCDEQAGPASLPQGMPKALVVTTDDVPFPTSAKLNATP